jgi:GNAT superfamily N-acetyltransferase
VTHGVGRTRYFRVSRVVTIPDYQGIGVARSLLDFVGEKYSREGKLPLTMVTSNPQFIHARLPNWRIVRIGHASPHSGARDNREIEGIWHSSSARRITISMRYVP